MAQVFLGKSPQCQLWTVLLTLAQHLRAAALKDLVFLPCLYSECRCVGSRSSPISTASLKPQVIPVGADDSLGCQLSYLLQLVFKELYGIFLYRFYTFFLSLFYITYFLVSKHGIPVSFSLFSSSSLAFWVLGSSKIISIWVSGVEWVFYCLKYNIQVGSNWFWASFPSIYLNAGEYKGRKLLRGFEHRFSRAWTPFLLLFFFFK